MVLPERGHVLPGRLIVGGDSHSPTGGAFGAYMFGVGATEMAGVLATGEIWLRVPHTIRLQWDGQLAAGVCAKDMMLFLCATLGMGGGHYEALAALEEARLAEAAGEVPVARWWSGTTPSSRAATTCRSARWTRPRMPRCRRCAPPPG